MQITNTAKTSEKVRLTFSKNTHTNAEMLILRSL